MKFRIQACRAWSKEWYGDRMESRVHFSVQIKKWYGWVDYDNIACPTYKDAEIHIEQIKKMSV